MVKLYKIRVPHDVITRGNPEEPRLVQIEAQRWIPMPESSWRSEMFSQMMKEGGTTYRNARIGTEPERLSTWLEATKMWDRWRASMVEFQRAAEWAPKHIPPQDLEAGAVLTFQSEAGVEKEVIYSLWTGDNEESYMYRANTAWSNVDPVPTDAELDTSQAWFRDIIKLRQKGAIPVSERRGKKNSNSHKLSKQDKAYLEFLDGTGQTMRIVIAERRVIHRTLLSAAGSSSQGATSTGDDGTENTESLTQQVESLAIESDDETSTTAKGKGKMQATVEDSAE